MNTSGAVWGPVVSTWADRNHVIVDVLQQDYPRLDSYSRFALKLKPEDARDAVPDAVEHVWRQGGQHGHMEGHPEAWVTAGGRNKIHDLAPKMRVRPRSVYIAERFGLDWPGEQLAQAAGESRSAVFPSLCRAMRRLRAEVDGRGDV